MATRTRDIHDLIQKQSTVINTKKPITFKIKKSRETSKLFTGSFRSVLIVTAYDYFRVTRIKCLTKNSSHVYLPIDYPEKVIFTNIEISRCSLSRKKNNKKIWLAVVKKFSCNRATYDVGDIINIKRSSLWRRLTQWMRHDVRAPVAEVFLYPSKKRARIAVQLLETYCKHCDPPGEIAGCSKYPSEAMERDIPPFLLTIPFDPFKRSIASTDNVSNASTNTTYFENVLVEGTDSFDVFIVSNTNDNRLTALVVPENVLCSVDELPTHAITNVVKQIECRELLDIKQNVIPQIISIENIEEVTEIIIRNLDEDNLKKDIQTSSTIFNSFVYTTTPSTYKKIRCTRSSSARPHTGSFSNPLQYTFENSTAEQSSDGRTSESELSEEEYIPDRTNKITRKLKQKHKNEYLLPLNQLTNETSFFQSHGNNNNNAFQNNSKDNEQSKTKSPGNVGVPAHGNVRVELNFPTDRSQELREESIKHQLEFDIYKEKPKTPKTERLRNIKEQEQPNQPNIQQHPSPVHVVSKYRQKLESKKTDEEVVLSYHHENFNEITSAKPSKKRSNSLFNQETFPKKSAKSPKDFVRKLKTTQPRPASQSFIPLITSDENEAMGNNFYYSKTTKNNNKSLKSKITFFEDNS